jgi:hypothetical protein
MRSTISGYWRQRGGPEGLGTPATFKGHILVTFDPTQVLAGTGKYLPKGAIPIGVTGLGGGTGGISPTVDLSLAGGAAGGLANELAADATTAEVTTGAELRIALTADTEIEAGVGASAATGGTFQALVSYIIADDGKRND